uniref:Uncharacterized protein n=1 Tax=Anopheles melas TaxID=34690 RepID=A0A182TP00_9DIPT
MTREFGCVWPLLLVRHRVRIGKLWRVMVGGRGVLRVAVQVGLVVTLRTIVSTRVAGTFVVVDIVQRSLPVATEITVTVIVVVMLMLRMFVVDHLKAEGSGALETMSLLSNHQRTLDEPFVEKVAS